MESSVLRDMPDKELKEMLFSEKEKLYKMKMTHEISPLENPNTIPFTRKVIARLKTEISRRNIILANKG